MNIEEMPIDELDSCSPFFPIPISSDDREWLFTSIAAKGILEPICLWKDEQGRNWIVSGYVRFKIAQDLHHSSVPVYYKDFADKAEALEYYVTSNVMRRHLTKDQKAVYAAEFLLSENDKADAVDDTEEDDLSEETVPVHQVVQQRAVSENLEVESEESSDIEEVSAEDDQVTESDGSDFGLESEESVDSSTTIEAEVIIEEDAPPIQKTTIKEASQIFDVNSSYISKANKILREAPEKLEEIKSGKLRLNKAYNDCSGIEPKKPAVFYESFFNRAVSKIQKMSPEERTDLRNKLNTLLSLLNETEEAVH